MIQNAEGGPSRIGNRRTVLFLFASVALLTALGICVHKLWYLRLPDTCVVELPIDRVQLEYEQAPLDENENSVDSSGAHQPIIRIRERGKLQAEFPLIYSLSSRVELTLDWIPGYGRKGAIEITRTGLDSGRYLYALGDAFASEVIDWKGNLYLVPISQRGLGGTSVTSVTGDDRPVSNGSRLQPLPLDLGQLERKRLGTIGRGGWNLILKR